MTEVRSFNPTILREYDIRGIVGDTLTEADVRAAARAFGTVIVQAGGASVAVGYDGRSTSPGLADQAVAGLSECGLTVYRVGRGATPMLYYGTYALDADAGLMITGSHNPPSHNGIKLMLKGKPFFGADIKRLGEIAASGAFATGTGRAEDHPMLEAYVKRLLSDFVAGKELKVAWDAGNGAAGEAMAKLTAKLPGQHILLFEEIDGTFPNHHPDPTVEKNLEDLKRAVIDNGCDLGIAFDGDGDRIGVIDSLGRVIWGDQLMVFLARDVLADCPGATIIADVKASQIFFDEVDRMGGKSLMGQTGHSLVKKLMAQTGAPLAGEMSGHIFFAHKYYGFDDALYAAVRLLSLLGQSDDSVAQMRDALPAVINTPEIRFASDDLRKFEVVEEVKANLQGRAGIEVIDVDGVRVKSDDGWWLLRASNTQAVLVARCEASTHDGLNRQKASLIAELVACGVSAPEF